MERTILPLERTIRPPSSLVLQGWAKSLGILLLGLASIVTSVTAAVALDTVRDGKAQSECRSGLANATARLEGEINVQGWSAALQVRAGATPEEIERFVTDLTALTEKWRVAQKRRDNAEEICGED